MHSRLTLVFITALSLAASAAVEADDTSQDTASEWSGRIAMAKSPNTRPRERPDDQAPTIDFSLAGIWLVVRKVEGDWLKVDEGWIRASDLVRDDEVVSYFTTQLEQGESVFFFLGRARGWLKQKELDKAQADLIEALRLDPQNARVFYGRAVLAHDQQRPDEELANYDRAVLLDSRDTVALTARGYARSRGRDYGGAIQDYDAAIAILPSAYVIAARGWCWMQQKDYDKALSDASEAIRLDPRYAAGFALRAKVNGRRQRHDDAIADATEAVRLDPKRADAFATRGTAYGIQGKLDAAMNDLDEAVRLGRPDATTYSNRARVHFLKQEFQAAVLDYTQAISLWPNNPEYYYRRSEAWSKKGDVASSIADLTEVIRLRPDFAQAYSQRGWLRDAPNEAFADFQKALELQPRLANALAGRANVWMDRGDLAQAIADSTAALEIEPQNVFALLARGGARFAQGREEEALADIEAALRLDDRANMAYYLRGQISQKRGELEKAADEYSEAIRRGLVAAGIWLERADCWIGLGRYKDAIDDATEALRRQPDDQTRVHALTKRSYARMEKNEFKTAIDDANEAVRLDPSNSFVLGVRAFCWIALRDFDKAFEDANQALRVDPGSEYAATLREQAQTLRELTKSAKMPIENDDSDGFHEILERLEAFQRTRGRRQAPNPETNEAGNDTK